MAMFIKLVWSEDAIQHCIDCVFFRYECDPPPREYFLQYGPCNTFMDAKSLKSRLPRFKIPGRED